MAIKEAELSIESDPKQWALDALAGSDAQQGKQEEGAEQDKPQEKEGETEGNAKKPRVRSRKHLDKELKQQAEFAELQAWDWRTELLDDKRKMAVYKVLHKPDPWRLCGKCNYRSGCLSCDPEKALRYHLVKQGWTGPGIWPAEYLQGR